MAQNESIRNIVILGGGSAGWITAGTIAAQHIHNQQASDISVTLVESDTIPAIGVGEGTWPTMRNTLLKMGIRETDFIRHCDASFKQGAKFAKWVTGEDDDFYYHPLMLPQGFNKVDLPYHWQQQTMTKSFSEAVCLQEALCEQGLAPKHIRTNEYSHVANYAYHLDAGKFTAFLQQHCTNKLGVKRIVADIKHIKSADNGDIDALISATGQTIEGDLFIDCSGFHSRLIDQHFEVPFKDCSDVLFIDNAIAVQVPYPEVDSDIASHTISTGQQAGWIWDIGLQQRRGVGHVYSSRHTSKQQAEDELAIYLGDFNGSLSTRHIPIKSGHRKTFWHKNCVAVGLSAGFLEPLEASALVLVELSAQMIAEQLPEDRLTMDIVAKRFNETFCYRWQRIIDFLKLHYILSRRQEPFWRDNCDPQTIPDSLQELMALWRYRAPADFDFASNNEVFPAASYQYVLYGMGFKTKFRRSAKGNPGLAQQQFELNQKMVNQATQQLPSNRELINKINQYGMHAI